eukprot:5955080-Pleurochrysis_carterae.AAC.1
MLRSEDSACFAEKILHASLKATGRSRASVARVPVATSEDGGTTTWTCGMTSSQRLDESDLDGRFLMPTKTGSFVPFSDWFQDMTRQMLRMAIA